jgi:hypothetical protein
MKQVERDHGVMELWVMIVMVAIECDDDCTTTRRRRCNGARKMGVEEESLS